MIRGGSIGYRIQKEPPPQKTRGATTIAKQSVGIMNLHPLDRIGWRPRDLTPRRPAQLVAAGRESTEPDESVKGNRCRFVIG